MSSTHRCSLCEYDVDHDEDEICASCGRCEAHCACHTFSPGPADDFDADELGIDPEEKYDA